MQSFAYRNDSYETLPGRKERKARALMEQGCLRQAIDLFLEIVSERVDWEHGQILFDLACCYEASGCPIEAEDYYRRALCLNPHDPYFLGAYASFLYLHGNPSEAYKAYLDYIKAEQYNKRIIDECMPALLVLASRLSLPDSSIQKDVAPPST